jgi:hypothetical protein
MAKQARSLTWRGYLLHLTHYDPVWWLKKAKEKPFDFDVAMEVLDALAEQKFNMLLIGVSDGVRYRSHPELRRHYSQPMSVLRTLADQARKRGMQIVPKLNFSRSEINRHNQWMRKPGQQWYEEFEDEAFFKKGFDAIDEVIDACKPERFFHVGMDEDHDRSHVQYVHAIETLRRGLKKRGLRAVCWSDSAIDYASGQVYREKSETAEREASRHVVRLLWNYWAVPAKEMQTIRRRGFELWGAPGARTLEQTTQFRDALLGCGGKGLVMTHWTPCIKANRKALLERIKTFGPVYGG